MAINVSPSAWIADYASDGTNITIPIASLQGLTSAEADAATGDIRKLLLAFEATMFATWDGKPQASQPKEWTVAFLPKTDDVAGTAAYSYTHKFIIKPTGVDVVNEP